MNEILYLFQLACSIAFALLSLLHGATMPTKRIKYKMKPNGISLVLKARFFFCSSQNALLIFIFVCLRKAVFTENPFSCSDF